MSKLIEAILETGKELGIDSITLKEIESLNLPEIKCLKPSEIKAMRNKEKISQTVMAKILNVTPSTYQKWERGEVQPKGANLKLLSLAYNHGVEYIVN